MEMMMAADASTMSSSTPLISIPLKPTSNVDFTSALSQTISSIYQENPAAYSNEIQALNRCRQDALRGSAGSELTQRDLLYKYFGQLELLELRFQDVRLPFEWKDAFTGKSISQMSLAYEKASVIFNIASTLSSLAQGQNRSNQEACKRAFNFLKSSAGMFSYINENFLHAPSTDLSRDIVKVLITLMLAQSTEVFLETTKESQKSIRSKVAAQAALLYSQIVEEVKEFTSKGIFDRSWSFLIQSKAKYFSAYSQYNRALHDVDSKKYGDALTRLSLAEPVIKESFRFGSSFMAVFSPHTSTTTSPGLSQLTFYNWGNTPPTLPVDAATSLSQMVNSLQSQITDLNTTLKKENDLIYHAIQPSVASLPNIEPAQVATPTTIQQIYSTADVQTIVGPDIFAKLIPLSVHESASLYSEEKAKLVRGIGESCDIADAEYTNGLETLGLPGSLSKFRNVSAYETVLGDPGKEVREWAREVKSSESSQGMVDAQMKELEIEKSKAKNLIAKMNGDMDTEMRECERARVKYEGFDQTPSMGLTKRWREAIKGDLEDMAKAEKSDEQLMKLWGELKLEVGILMMDEDQLEGWFAQQLVSDQAKKAKRNSLLDVGGELEEEEEKRETDKVTQSVESMDEGLIRLVKIKKERIELFKDLKEKVQADDISHILILNRKSPNVEPSLFSTELEKFRPYQNRITEAIKQQKISLAQLSTEWKTLMESKTGRGIQFKWKEVEKRKKDLIARCKHAKEGYWDVRAGLNGALHFYKSLNSSLESLASEIQSFLSSRNKERLKLTSEADLQQRLSSPKDDNFGVRDLSASVASMDLGNKPPIPAKPGQSQASWSANVTTPTPFLPSAPVHPPTTSAYGHFPTTGPFATQPHSQPLTTTYTPPTMSTSPFPPPPQPSQFSSPPLSTTYPPPTSYTSPYSQTPYSSLPPKPPMSQQGSQYGLPPPPTPISQTSLPPPSAPLNYQSSYQSSPYAAPPTQSQPGYPYAYPSQDPSFTPTHQTYSPYGQPPQPPQGGYGGQYPR